MENTSLNTAMIQMPVKLWSRWEWDGACLHQCPLGFLEGTEDVNTSLIEKI